MTLPSSPTPTPAYKRITPDCQPVFPCWLRTRGVVKTWIYAINDKRPIHLDNFDAWCAENPNRLEDISPHPFNERDESLKESPDSPTPSAQEAAERAARELSDHIKLVRGDGINVAVATGIILRHFQAVPVQSPGSGEALREAISRTMREHVMEGEELTNNQLLTDAILTAITPFLASPSQLKAAPQQGGLGTLRKLQDMNDALHIRLTRETDHATGWRMRAAELQGALKPFADALDEELYDKGAHDIDRSGAEFSVGELRFAKKAFDAATPLTQPATPPLPKVVEQTAAAQAAWLLFNETVRGKTDNYGPFTNAHWQAANALQAELTRLRTPPLPSGEELRAPEFRLCDHPLHLAIYNLAQQIEKCGASTELTKAVIMCGELQPMVASLRRNHRVADEMFEQEHNAWQAQQVELSALRSQLAQPPSVKIGDGKDGERLQKLLVELREIRAAHSEVGGRIAAAIGEAMDK